MNKERIEKAIRELVDAIVEYVQADQPAPIQVVPQLKDFMSIAEYADYRSIGKAAVRSRLTKGMPHMTKPIRIDREKADLWIAGNDKRATKAKR